MPCFDDKEKFAVQSDLVVKEKNVRQAETIFRKTDGSEKDNLKLKNRNFESKLVYSTELGKICPSCGKQFADCICRKKKTVTTPRGDGKIRVERSTKGRKGKGVSLIKGLPIEGAALKKLAKELKQQCGTGGTIKNGVIEIQGNHRDFLVRHLNSLGYKAVKAGG